MNLKEQQYVLMLAKYLNITSASEALYITQPALSAFLNNLEKRLGVTLFNRLGKKLAPTYAGELYIKNAKLMMGIKLDFERELSELSTEGKGRIRLGIQIRRSPQMIPPALAALKKIYPYVEVVIFEGNQSTLEAMVKDNQLDLIVSSFPATENNMEYMHICAEKLLLVVSEDHPLADSGSAALGGAYKQIDLQELKQELFLLQHPGQSIRKLMDTVMEEVDFKPERTMLIRNIETSVRLAAAGYGVTFVLESYAKHFVFTDNRPRYFSVGQKDSYTNVAVVYQKGMFLPEYMRAFIEIIRDLV